jgi:hypothetical protein
MFCMLAQTILTGFAPSLLPPVSLSAAVPSVLLLPPAAAAAAAAVAAAFLLLLAPLTSGSLSSARRKQRERMSPTAGPPSTRTISAVLPPSSDTGSTWVTRVVSWRRWAVARPARGRSIAGVEVSLGLDGADGGEQKQQGMRCAMQAGARAAALLISPSGAAA